MIYTIMKFEHTNKEGGIEQVELAQWAWLAIYKDASYLKQFDEATMKFHQFNEINLAELEVFVVINTQQPDAPGSRYEIHIEEGMTPIFFTRVTVFNMKEPGEIKVRMPNFGYKQTINGKSVKTIMTIFPSGAVAIRNTDDREHLE